MFNINYNEYRMSGKRKTLSTQNKNRIKIKFKILDSMMNFSYYNKDIDFNCNKRTN